MPIYDYECSKCGPVNDVFAGVNDHQKIHDCGGVMHRVLHSRYAISFGGIPPAGYYDETLGAHITTKRQRERLMAEQGVTEKGATPKNEMAWV